MDFVDFQVTVNDDNQIGNGSDEVSSITSLDSLINDTENLEDDVTTYDQFEEVSKSIDNALSEAFDESLKRVHDFEEISNFCESSEEEEEEEAEIDDFKNVEKRIDKVKDKLHRPNGEDSINSFVYAVLYGVRFLKTEKIYELQENLVAHLFLKLFENKYKFKLADSSYFLRAYKLKRKFQHLSLKNTKKRQL